MSFLDYTIPDDLPQVGEVVACGKQQNNVYQTFVRTEEKLFVCMDYQNNFGGVICRWYNIRRLNDPEKGVV